jgi:hypothetical protein
MPLPKIEHPIHEVYLKSLDRVIRYRPFLVKEEKLLLMAKESDDLNDIVKAIKQIIRNCVLDDIDVDTLPTFDVEMFFINLRVQSIGESAEMVYTCNNVVEGDVECGHKIDFLLDIRNVEYSETEGHSNVIRLSDTAGIKLNYPTLNFSEAELNDNFEDGGYSFVSQYLDYVYDSEQIYKKDEISDEELKEFIDNLTIEQVKQIRNFFTTLPQVFLKQDVTCPKCNYVHHLNVEGLLNFFE